MSYYLNSHYPRCFPIHIFCKKSFLLYHQPVSGCHAVYRNGVPWHTPTFTLTHPSRAVYRNGVLWHTPTIHPYTSHPRQCIGTECSGTHPPFTPTHPPPGSV
ncbi:hypothetical protein XENTR_v10004587 [Xenopus tropicalis]|nr:hypothetical protein XENTR_v10004587 [Xenopus tropicalis]